MPLLTCCHSSVQGSYRNESIDSRPAKVSRSNNASSISKSAASKPAAKTVRNMVPLKNMVSSSSISRGKSSQSIEEVAAITNRVSTPT